MKELRTHAGFPIKPLYGPEDLADVDVERDVGRIDSRVGLEVFDQAGGGRFESGGASGGEEDRKSVV